MTNLGMVFPCIELAVEMTLELSILSEKPSDILIRFGGCASTSASLFNASASYSFELKVFQQ